MLKGYDNNYRYKQKSTEAITVKSNYHTHNYLCGHAGGTVSDYAQEAIKHGMTELGISDHCIPPVASYEPYVSLSTIDEKYLPQFDAARKKYSDKLKIYSGVEIEYFEGHDDYYKALLKKLDYLVLGQHEYMRGRVRCNTFFDGVDDENILAYFDNVKLGLKSGFFALLAHPDLIFYNHPKITNRVVDGLESVVIAAKEGDVPLELNANGIRNHRFRYPTDILIELCKKHDAPVVISADAHTPVDLCDHFDKELYAYAIDNRLNIVYEGIAKRR